MDNENLMHTICAFIVAWQTENNKMLDVDLDIMHRSMLTIADKDIEFKTGLNDDGRYIFEIAYIEEEE